MIRAGNLYDCAGFLEKAWRHKIPSLRNHKPSFREFYQNSLGKHAVAQTQRETRPKSTISGSSEKNGSERIKDIEALAAASFASPQRPRLLPNMKLFESVKDQRTDTREQWTKFVTKQHVLEDELARSQSRMLLDAVHNQKLLSSFNNHQTTQLPQV